jgi:triacylglycerol lipase
MSRLLFALIALQAGCAGPRIPRRFDVEPQALLRKSDPVLLVHGMLAAGRRPSPGLTTFSPDIVRALSENGFDVWLPALPAIAPPVERAEVLLRDIDEVLRRTGAHAVHLIAHSQGGIDARIVLDDPRAAGKIRSLTTLSTPHAGTPMAEIALRLRGSLSETFIDRSARRIDESRGWPNARGQLRDTARALTPTAMSSFNLAHARAPVPLFSLAATPEPARDGACDGGAWPAPTRHGHRSLFMIIGGQMLDDAVGHESNDGFVPTRSQRFGIFLGCAPFDHAGWLHASRDGIDVLGFFVELARGLRELERTGDASAMDAHVGKLGALVGAH